MTVLRCWCCRRDIGLRNATSVTVCDRCRDEFYAWTETRTHIARVTVPERRATVTSARKIAIEEATTT